MNQKKGKANLKKRLLSPEKGAATSILLASSPGGEGVSGKYFENKKVAESSKESRDQTLAKRLWQVGEELTGLH